MNSLPPPTPTPPSSFPPPDAAARGGRAQRFRSEVMAGGAARERAELDNPSAGPAGQLAGVAILGLLVWLAFTHIWIFVFVIGILVSVFLHELGHFVTARLTGMKATQFFIGFGPRLWSFQRGETEYGVRLLPLGAFVKIIGMNNLDDVDPADEARTYRQQSFPRRLLVISAGSIMHMLVAAVLLFAMFGIRGELQPVPGIEVGAVSDGAPAASAGLQPGDVLLAIDGDEIGTDERLVDLLAAFAPGQTITIDLRRASDLHTVAVELGEAPATAARPGAAFLGVTSGAASEWQRMPLGEAAVASVTRLPSTAWESARGVVKVLNPVSLFQHLSNPDEAPIESRPTTLVGAANVTDRIAERDGWAGVVYVLAALNVFIGVFNMFPLLPLDGGHAAIAIYERIREIGRGGRRYFADVAKLMPFALGVIMLLALLFTTGLYLDIANPL